MNKFMRNGTGVFAGLVAAAVISAMVPAWGHAQVPADEPAHRSAFGRADAQELESAQATAQGTTQAPPAKPADAAGQQNGKGDDGDLGYTVTDPAKRAEAFYNFTMGHLNEVYYLTTNQIDFANTALDFYKKAYAIDPGSPVIGEHLAEMYFEARRTNDAIQEATATLQKDPSNLPARRLLVRIYVRTLGAPSSSAGEQQTATRAIEQLEQIRRLDPKDTDSELWLVRLYRLRGDTAKAENVLRDLLKQNPNDEAAVEQAAQLMLDENRAQEAVNLLKDVVERAPSARLSDLLGDAYAAGRDFPDAERAYAKAVELEPEEPGHRRGLAQTLAGEGKFEEALGQYQRLASMEPDDPDNFLHMAEMDRQLHRLDEAEKNIVQAKERAPGNLEIVYSEAMIYESQGRYEDGIQVISAAVAKLKSGTTAAPSNRRQLAVLYEQLGRLYREAGKYPAALNTFGEMAALGDEEARRADLLMIETYRAAHDLPRALETAQKALTQYPEDRELRITRALLYGDNADADQAAKLLRELLTRSPRDLEIDLDLAQVYQQNKRYADAEAALAQAINVAERDADREMVWFMLGAVYDRQKKFDAAEEEFKKVLAADPQNGPALNYYGYMLADRGVRLPEATDMLKRAVAQDPNNGSFLDSLGWAYFKQDRLAEAEDTLRVAAQRELNDGTILEHLGDVYFKRGKLDLAAAQWQRALEESQRALPADADPEKVTALGTKLSKVKQQLAEQKTNGPAKPRN